MPNMVKGFCKGKGQVSKFDCVNTRSLLFRFQACGIVIFAAVLPNRNIRRFVNFFLGPLLFAWLFFSIYKQVLRQPQLEASWLQIRNSFQSERIWFMLGAIVLIPVNWGLEAWKWKMSIRSIHLMSFATAFKAILSGISFSVTMPNRVGEYFGRIMYMPEGARLKTISVTLVGSFAQLIVTIVFGLFGLLMLKTPILRSFPDLQVAYQFAFYGLLLMAIVLAFLYFNVSALAPLTRRWTGIRKFAYLVEALSAFDTAMLVRLILLSTLRYFVFLIQYLLVYNFFDVQVHFLSVITVMNVVFLAMAIIPSVALIEIGLRGEISLMLMGMFSNNKLGIGFSSITVWFLNLIFPAIIGSLLILSIRIFKKRYERA